MDEENNKNLNASGLGVLQRPDSFGRFGKFGGKYVPETLMHALTELETAFDALADDQEFQVLISLFFFYLNEFMLVWRFVCLGKKYCVKNMFCVIIVGIFMLFIMYVMLMLSRNEKESTFYLELRCYMLRL